MFNIVERGRQCCSDLRLPSVRPALKVRFAPVARTTAAALVVSCCNRGAARNKTGKSIVQHNLYLLLNQLPQIPSEIKCVSNLKSLLSSRDFMEYVFPETSRTKLFTVPPTTIWR